MKLCEIAAKCLSRLEGEVSENQLYDWLYEIETVCLQDVASSYECSPSAIPPFSRENGDYEMLADGGYCSLYVKYCLMQRDLFYGDLTAYERSLAAFADTAAKWAAAYGKNHKAKRTRLAE